MVITYNLRINKLKVSIIMSYLILTWIACNNNLHVFKMFEKEKEK